jgi:hypothetical protein
MLDSSTHCSAALARSQADADEHRTQAASLGEECELLRDEVAQMKISHDASFRTWQQLLQASSSQLHVAGEKLARYQSVADLSSSLPSPSSSSSATKGAKAEVGKVCSKCQAPMAQRREQGACTDLNNLRRGALVFADEMIGLGGIGMRFWGPFTCPRFFLIFACF